MKKFLGFFQRPESWMWVSVLVSVIFISWSAVDWTLKDLKQAAFDFGLAILVSVLIYLLVSLWPEKRKKTALQSFLNGRYDELLDELIPQYLWACEQSCELDVLNQLKEQEYFNEYFKLQFNESQSRWDAVANSLQIRGASLTAVILALKRFQTELDFCITLSAVNVEQDGFARLRDLSKDLKRISQQALTDKSDGIKEMCRFLWSLHTGWSHADGYSGKNHIKESIANGF